jgi:hypothetical protein
MTRAANAGHRLFAVVRGCRLARLRPDHRRLNPAPLVNLQQNPQDAGSIPAASILRPSTASRGRRGPSGRIASLSLFCCGLFPGDGVCEPRPPCRSRRRPATNSMQKRTPRQSGESVRRGLLIGKRGGGFGPGRYRGKAPAAVEEQTCPTDRDGDVAGKRRAGAEATMVRPVFEDER